MVNIKLPKSNCSWQITDQTYRHSVEIRASFTMPNGEVLHSASQIDKFAMEAGRNGEDMVEHVIRHTMEGLVREVGRKMVMG